MQSMVVGIQCREMVGINMKSQRSKFAVIAVCVVLLVVAVSTAYIYKKGSRLNPPVGIETIDGGALVSDIPTPSVDKVLSDSGIDTSQKYDVLSSYATTKREFMKYDDALTYYEAALKVVNGDSDKTTDTQYAIYKMAIESGNQELAQRYAQLIGAEKLESIKQEAIKRDYDR